VWVVALRGPCPDCHQYHWESIEGRAAQAALAPSRARTAALLTVAVSDVAEEYVVAAASSPATKAVAAAKATKAAAAVATAAAVADAAPAAAVAAAAFAAAFAAALGAIADAVAVAAVASSVSCAANLCLTTAAHWLRGAAGEMCAAGTSV